MDGCELSREKKKKKKLWNADNFKGKERKIKSELIEGDNHESQRIYEGSDRRR